MTKSCYAYAPLSASELLFPLYSLMCERQKVFNTPISACISHLMSTQAGGLTIAFQLSQFVDILSAFQSSNFPIELYALRAQNPHPLKFFLLVWKFFFCHRLTGMAQILDLIFPLFLPAVIPFALPTHWASVKLNKGERKSFITFCSVDLLYSFCCKGKLCRVVQWLQSQTRIRDTHPNTGVEVCWVIWGQSYTLKLLGGKWRRGV